MAVKMTLDEFWQKVQKTSTCWIWTGCVSNTGYGRVTVTGHKQDGAHRLSYEFANGPFDRDLYVLHRCDNPVCVNPDHLFLGTQKDNMADMIEKNRGKRLGRKMGSHNTVRRSSESRIAQSLKRQKPFSVTAPDGEIIHGVNLLQFCRDRGLDQPSMYSVTHGGKTKSHRGYSPPPPTQE